MEAVEKKTSIQSKRKHPIFSLDDDGSGVSESCAPNDLITEINTVFKRKWREFGESTASSKKPRTSDLGISVRDELSVNTGSNSQQQRKEDNGDVCKNQELDVAEKDCSFITNFVKDGRRRLKSIVVADQCRMQRPEPDIILAVQHLPKPPIANKYYTDNRRKELETWLWHPIGRTKRMKWLKARKQSWSLDCDGGYVKGTYGRFGSVIRDDEGGNEVFVFGRSPKTVSALYHEIESIYNTTRVAYRLGIRRISIRTDSLRAVELLTKEGAEPKPREGSDVSDILSELKSYLASNFVGERRRYSVRHQYKEMNNLADYVAGYHKGPKTNIFVVHGSLNVTTRYFLDRDRAGLAYYWDRDRKKAEKKRKKNNGNSQIN